MFNDNAKIFYTLLNAYLFIWTERNMLNSEPCTSILLLLFFNNQIAEIVRVVCGSEIA